MPSVSGTEVIGNLCTHTTLSLVLPLYKRVVNKRIEYARQAVLVVAEEAHNNLAGSAEDAFLWASAY